MHKPLLAALALVTLATTGAFAQAPPMDMSWAFRMQMQNQAMGDAMAYGAAMQYYNYMLALRRQGYTGPSLPTGVTPQSLQNSINGANEAAQRYIAGMQRNSERNSFTVNDYSMRAIRGCYRGYDRWGNFTYVCP